MKPIIPLYTLLLSLVYAHQTTEQAAFTSVQDPIDISNEPWTSKYGLQHDLGFTGPLSFSHLPYARCLQDASNKFDIAILGFPFDTTTSYRPGARFGPAGIRHGSRRQSERGYTVTWGTSPYDLGATMMDCGDVPLSGYDNAKAIDQMEAAYSTLLMRPVSGGVAGWERKAYTAHLANDDKEHPRIITLGGDHTIVLPILRSLNKVYGPVSVGSRSSLCMLQNAHREHLNAYQVIHFDAHLDTWAPRGTTAQERITHGSFFAVAAEEHLIRNTSVHAGIRCKMIDIGDVEHDDTVGFQIVSTDDIDDYGINKVIKAIRSRVGYSPVYLSLDIDVVDPGLAPATGTPEAGGWTTREVKRILRGLSGLNFVGADIVEVAPAYDHADITSIAAADIVYDFLTMLQTETPPPPHDSPLFRDLDD